MNYYKENSIRKIENIIKKWVILTILLGLFAIGVFVIFLLLSNYNFHLLFQILSSFILGIYGVYLVFIIDTVFVEYNYLKKHYIITFLSGSELYEGKVLEIGKVITVSPRIKARLIVIEIHDKKLTLCLLKDFIPNFEIGDKLVIESKNRFIFSTKEIEDEEIFK